MAILVDVVVEALFHTENLERLHRNYTLVKKCPKLQFSDGYQGCVGKIQTVVLVVVP